MVRNTNGGSKAKSQARKFSSNYASRSAIRLSACDLEQYAVVLKLYGQGRCLVHTVGDVEMKCVIRNKFRGRNKRNHVVALGTILLVGMREWEGDAMKTCDLLEVYDTEDVHQLLSLPATQVGRLERFMHSHVHTGTTSGTDEFTFGEESEGFGGSEVKKQKVPTEERIEEGTEEVQDIDFDDI